jgi:dTDP-4-amino-4,6-dideoxyglucose
MKSRVEDFATLGGEPEFTVPWHVAQVNLPSWEEIEEAFRGIFNRRYFANHGPLVHELDERFAEFIGTRNAVSVTNGTVALMILAKGLLNKGEVIVPAFTFPATAQALIWAGLTPVLCDVDPVTHMLHPDKIMPLITERTVGILGVHLWGRPCIPDRLEEIAAERKITLFFDSCHGAGCSYMGRKLGTFGIGEAFSFHATKIINAAEGGCITTDDDVVADRLRTIRSFHPSETYATVPLRMNGKMSEAQALLSLIQFPRNLKENRRKYLEYKKQLNAIPGMSLLDLEGEHSENNYQYIVVDFEEEEFGLSREDLIKLLRAENVICRRHFWPGLHKAYPYLNQSSMEQNFDGTDYLAARIFQLPLSQSMQDEDIMHICSLINDVHHYSKSIKKRLKAG